MSPLYLLLLSLAIGCLGSCPPGRNCIKKCCPPKMKMSFTSCVPGDTDLDNYDTLVVHYRPNCSLIYLESSVAKIHPNGSLAIQEPGFPELTTEFCQDGMEGDNGILIFACIPEQDLEIWEDEPLQSSAFNFYAIGLFISAFYLFATAVIYSSISVLRNLHGYCLICYNGSLFLSYVLLGLLHTNTDLEETTCLIFGYAIQFFFIATFFWLNVMCFDVSSAFSFSGLRKERERKKLIMYTIYAWCMPLLILVITVAVDFSPSVPVNSFFKPRLGEDKCFFKEIGATWVYFYLPMALIILSNIMLLGVTAFRIWSNRRKTVVLKREDSQNCDSPNDKERFILYLLLFIVMSINWVMEVLPSVVHSHLWYIPDACNILHGLFVFLIFVCNKRVIKLVWTKISSCCGR